MHAAPSPVKERALEFKSVESLAPNVRKRPEMQESVGRPGTSDSFVLATAYLASRNRRTEGERPHFPHGGMGRRGKKREQELGKEDETRSGGFNEGEWRPRVAL